MNNAVKLAEELRENISQMDIPGVGSVTASFGVAGYCPGDTVDSLVNRVDNMKSLRQELRAVYGKM